MKKYFHHALCLMIFSINALAADRVKAVVIVPVADLSGRPLLNYSPKKVDEHYDEFSYAPDKGVGPCFRMHQAKFNELVTISSDLSKEEVCCEFENLFFLNKQGKKEKSCWMLRKYLMPVAELEAKIKELHIPPPVMMGAFPESYNKNILTLIEPWEDETTKRIFSTGTRFVRSPKDDKENLYAVYILDPESLTETVALVPAQSALIDYPTNSTQARALMIIMLRKWAYPSKGITPYVFGGCSMTTPMEAQGFYRRKHVGAGKTATSWQRTGSVKKPLSGFDCSNMLLCAAQIAGLPYYYKNTHALARHLKPLEATDILEEGDLIWYLGHVMVVSDCKKNLLIEAAGYEFGYGKVQELPLEKVFQGIKTYKELCNAFHSRRFLRRLNSRGRPVRSIYQLQIFKLSSLK